MLHRPFCWLFLPYCKTKYSSLEYPKGALFINCQDLGHFENVAQEYSRLITVLARSYSLSDSENEDLFQEGLIALHKAFLTYRSDGGASFSTYACSCIKNSMVSWIRANRPPQNIIIDDVDDEKLSLYSADNTEEQVINAELRNRLLSSAKEILSPNEQKVFLLVLEDIKNKEIAKLLGVSSKSVENTVYRIKSKLKSKLKL